MSNNQSHITIRSGTAADGVALERLAQLDSGRVPADPVLLAEVDGEVVAAISVASGAAIADPFRPTAGHVETLRLQAGFETATDRGHRAFGRQWLRSQRPSGPRPTAPSVPGFPVLPGHTR
jgi:hypothetical protein